MCRSLFLAPFTALFLISPAWGQLTQVTTSPASDVWPSWTPDGASIVFASDRTGGTYQVYKIPAGGGTAVQLSTGSGGNYPEVSPDGTQIAFAWVNAIYVIPIAGGPATFLGSSGDVAWHPSWSLDGDTVYFSRRNDLDGYDWDLMQVPASGGAVTYLLNTSDAVSGPRISPDGLTLAYEENYITSPINVFAGPIGNPGNHTQLTFETEDTGQVWYSPDGASLAYVSRKNTGWLDLYLLDLSTMTSTQLTFDAIGFDPETQGPSFSPDGTKIAFSSRRITGENNIWVLNLSTPGVVAASVALEPGTLNTMAHNKWIEADIELPAGYDPQDIILGTVRLMGTIPADPTFDESGDFNHNGIPERRFRFDRDPVVQALPPEATEVKLVVTGDIQGDGSFAGADTVKVVRPKCLTPNGEETLSAGSTVNIGWDEPSGWSGTSATLSYSTDGGAVWNVIATGMTGKNYSWTVPDEPSGAALVKVDVMDEYGLLGADRSDGVFTIASGTVGAGDGYNAGSLLLQNAPNPFSASTTIGFELRKNSPVSIAVFDAQGRKVRELLKQWMPMGSHEVRWDGTDASGTRVGSGVYFYRMVTNEGMKTKKLFLMR